MAIEPSKDPLSGRRQNGNQGRSDMKCKIKQTMTALGPIVSTIAAGMTSGYSAILIPQLKSSDSTNPNVTSVTMTDYLNMNELKVSGTEEESWIAASAALTMIPGCWMAGIMMEQFGRKGAFLILSPIYFVGWLLVGLAPSIFWLIIGRLISGFCSGINGPLSPVFIAETSDPSLRGIFLAGISLAIAIGVLVSHILGTWLHWRLSALLCGLFPALCFILCAIAPESPTWLVNKDKSAKAHKVWVSLRGEYCEQEFEGLQSKGTKMRNIIKYQDDSEESPGEKSFQDNIAETSSSPPNWKTTITSRSLLLPLLILIVLFFTSQFSGNNAVVFYSVNLFEDVASPDNAYMATLLLDVIRVVLSVVACWMTRNYGCRFLTMASGIGTVISLMLLSGSLFTELGKPWLPICLLIVYMCAISIGLVPLPWLLCGELFSPSVRGLGSGLTSSFGFTFFFIVVKTSPGLNESIGPSWTFALYGIIVFAGTIFLYFYLPETKGKTLNEIEERFANFNNKNGPKFKMSAPENR